MFGPELRRVAPLITVKVSQQMEAATLLAKALLDPILEEGRQLQVLLADAITLVVLLLACEILIAAIHLQQMQVSPTKHRSPRRHHTP